MPSGADNVLTIHTTDGTERFRIDSSGNAKVGSAATISPDGDLFVTGVCTATTLSGAASGLTGALPAISAANLTNVPAANITGTLPAISAANLTNVPAANITGTLPAISATNLTNIPAANITGTLPAISGANLTGIEGGLSMADSWRVTANFTGDADVINSNWERFDTSPWENNLGTGMSESSGVFTFPSTGYYFLSWSHYIYLNQNSSWNEMEINITNDGGSSYTALQHTEMFTTIAAATVYSKATETALLDITNVSNQKFYFKVSVDNNSIVTLGSDTKKQTGFDIFKLGDT